ncbi:MAG TPA: 23S rRNA (guanosine(2251)-2'-O)-methyltransferase RlmB [Bdellovibrionales bacterium]|nr:23S rRNA (guanosine(2251)-2'-O)-methyltransferase RlmB [Bdellovibrionales bacterium]
MEQKSHKPGGRCVVGIHAVRELLKVRPRAVDQIWLRDRYQDHPDLKELNETAQRLKVRVHQHPVGALDKVIGAHQGVLAFTQEQPEIDWDDLKTREKAVVLALDEVEDPHNLGAVMRTAWLFGAQGILIPEHRSADLSPAVSKVAQGAAEHIPVEKDNALPQQLERLKEMGFWILGLSHKGKQGLFELEIPQKVVWVLGSESGGIRKSVEGVCDDLIAIPQSNPEASYNVSVAAAVALAETFRQKER